MEKIRRVWKYYVMGGLATLLITACHKDPEPDTPAPEISISDINGRWASVAEDGEATELDFQHQPGITNVVSMTEYSDYQVSFSGYGGWVHVANTNTITLGMENVTTWGEMYTIPYRIEALNANSMTLTNQNLGSTRTYKKVKDAYTLLEGETKSLSLPGAWEVDALPGPIAKVSGDKVTGLSYGTDFLGVSYKGNSWYVSLTVEPQFFLFLNLLDGTVSDIRKTFGTPDLQGIGDNGLHVLRYLHPREYISAVDFFLDKGDSLIAYIAIAWSDQEAFKRTENYISSHYTKDAMTADNGQAYLDGENVALSKVSFILYPKSRELTIWNLATLWD